jgi:hypothetical protein
MGYKGSRPRSEGYAVFFPVNGYHSYRVGLCCWPSTLKARAFRSLPWDRGEAEALKRARRLTPGSRVKRQVSLKGFSRESMRWDSLAARFFATESFSRFFPEKFAPESRMRLQSPIQAPNTLATGGLARDVPRGPWRPPHGYGLPRRAQVLRPSRTGAPSSPWSTRGRASGGAWPRRDRPPPSESRRMEPLPCLAFMASWARMSPSERGSGSSWKGPPGPASASSRDTIS